MVGALRADNRDTAGQEEYSSMQDQWFRSGQGFVLVYSMVNRKSFRDIKPLYEKILRIKFAKSVPIVLVRWPSLRQSNSTLPIAWLPR